MLKVQKKLKLLRYYTVSPEIEILNPEQIICNLDEKTNFHMETELLDTGKGYVSAVKNKTEDSTS